MTELEYFKGDELAASTWRNKYAAGGEQTPDDTHKRLAKEFARVESNYNWKSNIDRAFSNLSNYGYVRPQLDEEAIYQLFKDFKYIIPGGSVMSGCGTGALVSLSNCFVIGSPKDSYAEIMKTRSQQAQLMKRRGGVGYDLSQLRPRGAKVNNAAKSSTGAASFMDVCSDITNEVAQNGRRGALMLSMSINHPDIEEFITKKQDLTKVTGANISVKVTDEFMQAVENDKDYILRFPVDESVPQGLMIEEMPYNELWFFSDDDHPNSFFKKVRARELWDTLMHCAWNTAEPGIMFEGAMHNYSPDGVYPDFKMVGTNPCFHPDTLIETVEGRKRIADITEPTYVYSMSRDGHICIVPSTAAFKTRDNAKTLKITLRNGSSIMVTPEHKMFVQGVGFVEAQNLKIGDRIAHILRSRRGRRYVGVKLTTEGNRDYVMEHRLVYEGIYGQQIDKDIHHLDANTFNNVISNLQSISHSEHARLTALEQNPQTHQVRGEDGRFISSGEMPVWRNTESLPTHLATKCSNQWDNCIVSIEEGEQVDVYDIQVPETHCLIANNMVAHNCGEIPMGPFDSCRLIHINLSSYIVDPFTDKAHIDEELLYMHSYEAMRLADDLVDLEIEAVDRIINTVKNDTDDTEFKLWSKIKETAIQGRRAGLGFTGLADAIAMLGLKYDSDEGISQVGQLMKVMFKGQLDSNIDMAIERGSFPAWDSVVEAESNSDWLKFIRSNYLKTWLKMAQSGRRNISWSTVAPTGTVSIMAGTSSGIEPVFMPFYQRKRKCMSESDRVDYVDKVGEKYTLFTVVHPNLKKWAIETLNYSESEVNEWSLGVWKEVWKESPYYGSTAPEIDWRQRVKLQGVVQKYITHSISSTVNLAKETTEEEIADIYIEAWKQGLKGITIYRDGCREGVLTQVEKPKTIEGRQAPKRPKVLEADYYQVKVKKEQFIVLVGLLEGKPYEVFAFRPLNPVNIPAHKGTITKVSKMHYSFDSEHINISNLELANTNIEENAATLYSSMLLRHGVDINYIIKTARKVNDNISSFSSAMCRILAKYIPNGEVKGEVCPDCGSSLTRTGGCISCTNCGYSRCN